MVLATDLFHMMDPSGAPQNVNFDEPVATFDARYVLSGAEAPVGAEYVVISLDGDLTDERVLTGTANQISIADGGAGGNVTLSTPQDIHTAATPEFDGVIIGSADGIDCNPGADIDTDLISIGVTGNPLLKWDESENAFDFSTIIALPTTTPIAGQIKQNSNLFMHSYGTSNLFFGPDAGNLTLTGQELVGIGANTLNSVTDGQYNVAIGAGALTANDEGDYNIAIGSLAMTANTSGNTNLAIGRRALLSNTTGYKNISLGQNTLVDNIDGIFNVAIGGDALSANLESYNVGIGGNALKANTTGEYNTAIGFASLLKQTTGYYNVAIGYKAGENQTGAIHYNTVVGTWALRYNVTGAHNTVIGFEAGKGVASNSHSGNTAIGSAAGKALTTGSNNVLLGYLAGDVLTTGASNIIIGYDIDPSAAGVSNELTIGDLIKGYLAAHGSGPAINLMGGTPQAQQAHIVDADGQLADITTKFNTLLADLEGYGLLAAV